MDRLTNRDEVHVHHEGIPSTSGSVSFPMHLLDTRVGHFVAHFVEMCVAMCLGLAVLDLAYVWVAGQVGIADPFRQLPGLSVAIVAFNMTAPMAAWMRFRGMAWDLIAEMSAAMVAEAILILGAYGLGILPNATVNGQTALWSWQHGLMMPVMLVPMLLRLDHYTGSMRHHAHAG
jgi:hypothetical protein